MNFSHYIYDFDVQPELSSSQWSALEGIIPENQVENPIWPENCKFIACASHFSYFGLKRMKYQENPIFLCHACL